MTTKLSALFLTAMSASLLIMGTLPISAQTKSTDSDLSGDARLQTSIDNKIDAGRFYPNDYKAKTSVLYRYYNRSNGDHFYTTNYNELGAGNSGYRLEGNAGYVHLTQSPGTIPLYRYYNSGNGDHFYTTTYSELGSGGSGYISEGISGYVRTR
jgi:hypothetical protein